MKCDKPWTPFTRIFLRTDKRQGEIPVPLRHHGRHTCSSVERGSIQGHPVNIRSPLRVLPLYRPSRPSHSHHQFLELLAVHEAASSIRLERRWWSIHRVGGAHGFWEEKVGQWHRIAQTFPILGEADDYLDKRYLRTYRVDSRTFQFLLRQTGQALQRLITRFRATNFPCQTPCNVLALACPWHHF